MKMQFSKLMATNLFILLMFGTSINAEELVPSDQGLTDAVRTVQKADQALSKAGNIDTHCATCKELMTETNSISLNKNEIDLDRPLFLHDDQPVIYHLKRTANSPKKLVIKFKNPHLECAKLIMGSNPLNGAIYFDCLIRMTQYDDQELDLNLSKLSPLKNGEEQIIELQFSKKDIQKTPYTVQINSLNGKNLKVERDNKFFGSGINFKLMEKESE
jgi:hypothetical protein